MGRYTLERRMTTRSLAAAHLINIKYRSLEGRLYRARPQTLNFDSARQSSIEALRAERGSPSPSGKGDEEDRLSEVAASQNLKFEAARGITPIRILESDCPINNA